MTETPQDPIVSNDHEKPTNVPLDVIEKLTPPTQPTPDAVPQRAAEPVSADMEKETEALIPEPSKPFKLSDGTEVMVRQLNLKEFLVMMRIVTRGAAVAFNGGFAIDPGSDTFVTDMVSLFIFAVAEAEYEACEFLRVMVDPVENTEEKNQQLDILMQDPSLEDAVDIINYVIAKAAPNIKALGKRLATLMALAQRVGQLPS